MDSKTNKKLSFDICLKNPLRVDLSKEGKSNVAARGQDDFDSNTESEEDKEVEVEIVSSSDESSGDSDDSDEVDGSGDKVKSLLSRDVQNQLFQGFEFSTSTPLTTNSNCVLPRPKFASYTDLTKLQTTQTIKKSLNQIDQQIIKQMNISPKKQNDRHSK